MTPPTPQRHRWLPPIAISAAIIVLLVSGLVSLRELRELRDTRDSVAYTLEVIATLEQIRASVMDVESGQRGYLITGISKHLESIEPGRERARSEITRLDELTRDTPSQNLLVVQLRDLVEKRLGELEQALAIYETDGEQAAQDAVSVDLGLQTMAAITDSIDELKSHERDRLRARERDAKTAYRSALITLSTSTAVGLLLVGGVFGLLERNRRGAEETSRVVRETQQRLQFALDAADLGSWNVNPQTGELISDLRLREIFDAGDDTLSYDEALKKIHPDDRERVQREIELALDPGNARPFSSEYRIVLSDGSVRWVFGCGAARFDGVARSGNLVSFDGIALDITDRKRQEQRLRESERKAVAASRAKSEFLANMSHEIRTPMAAILGYADVLRGHLKDPDNQNCVSVIKRNGDYLLQIINDILDLSRIEAGRLEIEPEEVHIPKLLADIDSLMHVRAEAKNLPFEVKLDSAIPETINTDPIRLRQVLINLIGNAIKFTEKGRTELVVQCDSRADPKQIEFQVRDTGVGISEDQRQILFEPFVQADTSVTRKFGGSGLGLAISRRLTSMLGGELDLESQPGEGSTFSVRLPIEEDPAKWIDAWSGLHQDRSEVKTVSTRQLDCRVLVVDDRRDVRHISQHFLEKAGANVVTAENGLQAIEAAFSARDQGNDFDLIVMDMQMPHLDGMEATARLRSAGVQWPIIALTADAMRGDREKCLRGGCDDYLSKPVDHVALVEMAAKYTQDMSPDDLRQLRIERARSLRASLDDESIHSTGDS